uniref:Uncharacterized protein n=1 Tax=Podoviridae sp. ctYFd1 TaxID=2826560 RepID=A0A8S5R1K6_9CAUD|nr:MAG TPA: hypothetical protein [Podoviridae sp. ctYFd1]
MWMGIDHPTMLFMMLYPNYFAGTIVNCLFIWEIEKGCNTSIC